MYSLRDISTDVEEACNVTKLGEDSEHELGYLSFLVYDSH